MPLPRRALQGARARVGTWLLLAAGCQLLRSFAGGCGFAQLRSVRSPPRSPMRPLRAVKQEGQVKSKEDIAKENAELLEFETVKFNIAWVKMKDAEEAKSPEYERLRAEVKEQGKIVEDLGGSLPADMMTQEEMEAKAAKVKKDLTFEKLLKMTNEERWILAQGLGPAFPISLILSYTFYWTLNIPFIAYAYFTTVINGNATMALVMTGAYATSIPFKPLVYIGAILGTPWTAENVMPLVAKVFSIFRLPDGDDFDRL